MGWQASTEKAAEAITNHFGEATDYTGPGGAPGPVRVSAVWGEVVLAARESNGIYLDACEVTVSKPAMGATVPVFLGTLTRFPGEAGAETWTIEEVRQDEVWWTLSLSRSPRPTPMR